MFIGHFALGYAAKRWAPRLSLVVLFAAALFADLLWPVLVALGIERVRIAPGITASTPLEFISYPYSHSLLTLTVLACVGVTAFLFVGFVVNANGTPPPSVTALWMMALGLGALTLWLAWFADHHRRPRT
jgi:hypothetical protein